jgi:hypothetical protein
MTRFILLLFCASLLLFVVPAWGHGGPIEWVSAEGDSSSRIRLYIDFDPPNRVHSISPEVNDEIDAFVVVDCMNPENFPGGLGTICIRLEVDAGVSARPWFESLLPGEMRIGNWKDGITLASTPCAGESPVAIGVLHLRYLGKPGAVRILDHPDFPRWVVNCELDTTSYCVGSHGGIGMSAPAGEDGCECLSGRRTPGQDEAGIGMPESDE